MKLPAAGDAAAPPVSGIELPTDGEAGTEAPTPAEEADPGSSENAGEETTESGDN